MHRRCVWCRNPTTLQLLLHRLFSTAREREQGERAIQILQNFQNRKETENNPHTAPRITNLIDFHEFGVGARPFYGHLDDVCGGWHGERECPKLVPLAPAG